MVHWKACKSSPVNTDVSSRFVGFGVPTILMATIVACVLVMTVGVFGEDVIEGGIVDEIIGGETEESAWQGSDITEVEVEKIDFQPVVDEWVETISGRKGVVIYDLDLDRIVGGYNTDEIFDTASLYKLFVVYEGYRKVESGEWKIDTPAGVTGYTIGECLDLAIRESNSVCAETLWSMIGEEALDDTVAEEYRMADTLVSDFTSTPEDIAAMMRLFYLHPNIQDEALLVQMKDSFLNQPQTEYDWRQGLPSGFSDTTKVYNKVGWEYDDEDGRWNIYNDAAVVEFPDNNRHFVVVVMSNNVDYRRISKFGSLLEEYFKDNT